MISLCTAFRCDRHDRVNVHDDHVDCRRVIFPATITNKELNINTRTSSKICQFNYPQMMMLIAMRCTEIVFAVLQMQLGFFLLAATFLRKHDLLGTILRKMEQMVMSLEFSNSNSRKNLTRFRPSLRSLRSSFSSSVLSRLSLDLLLRSFLDSAEDEDWIVPPSSPCLL